MSGKSPAAVTLEFADNRLMPHLAGSGEKHFVRLEQKLGVRISSRGNHIAIEGRERALAGKVLQAFYKRLANGESLSVAEIDAEIRFALEAPVTLVGGTRMETIRTATGKAVHARSPRQSAYLQAMASHDLTFGIGPAGTGKTYLAAAFGASMLYRRQVDKLILSRPALEAGERLGFLPGDLKEKIDPYLRPLYDALYDVMGESCNKLMEQGTIEVAPLAFMRGRTLSRAFVILDEAQNCTSMQMKMFLTRLGEGSHMVVTGDASQSDLPRGMSGLKEAVDILKNVEGVATLTFENKDVVRHPLVTRIVDAYDAAGAVARAVGRQPDVARPADLAQTAASVAEPEKNKDVPPAPPPPLAQAVPPAPVKKAVKKAATKTVKAKKAVKTTKPAAKVVKTKTIKRKTATKKKTVTSARAAGTKA